jgi:hypothetical protein
MVVSERQRTGEGSRRRIKQIPVPYKRRLKQDSWGQREVWQAGIQTAHGLEDEGQLVGMGGEKEL